MNFFRWLSHVWKYRHQLEVRLKLLRLAGRILVPQYRFKRPSLDWWDNKSFDECLKKFGDLNGFVTDRRWALWQLIRLVDGVAGHTAECGVYQGASSYLICKANAASKTYQRCHFMFDSFEGLSTPSPFDGSHWTKGDLAGADEEVRKNLNEFENISFHKGWIPDGFQDVEDQLFSFVHIDVDLYAPTKSSIEFFYPRLSQGGIIVSDDYGSSVCAGATKAIDDYLLDKKEKMVSLPDGGGFLIKGCQTSDNLMI